MMRKTLSIVALAAVITAATAAAKPNVLFISVDDLNDFPAFMGSYPDALTPNMDRLAKRGIVFTNAHAQYPICGPSRASIMSGLHPSTLNYPDHITDEKVQQDTVKLGSKVINEYFSDHGYKTLAMGKVFHQHIPRGSVDVSGGRERGFNQGTGNLMRNYPQKGTSTDWAIAPEKDADLADYRIAKWTVEQLNEKHEKPFLMMVGFLRPHVPWYVPKKWFDLYDKEKITLPPYKADDFNDLPEISKKINIWKPMPRTEWAIEKKQWRNIVHAYLACISFVDSQIGKVIDALENSAYNDNTIIVLWSDHGYHMGEKNTFQKHSLWQRSSHVPMIFAGPNVKPGLRCNRVVSLIDIYPTLLEMCGLPANLKNEGRSITPLIADPETMWEYPAITSWVGNNYALQNERYRYITYSDGSEELYDHHNDPHEWTNIAANPEYGPLKTKLKAFLPKISFDMAKAKMKKRGKKSNGKRRKK